MYDSNSLALSSSLIPCPLSCTDIYSDTSLSVLAAILIVSLTYPSSVNFTALLRRLIRICRILNESPYSIFGRSASISNTRSTFFSERRERNIIPKSLNMDIGSYSPSKSSIFPDSIFDKSRISLIIPRRALPEFLIFTRYSISCFGRFSLRRMSVIPTIAFIGVLISWDILDRKALLAILARSACSFNPFMISFCSFICLY